MNPMRKVMALAAGLGCALGIPLFAHAQATAAPPSDPQIVGIVIAANQIDIDYAKLALSKTKNKQVRGFAQQMVTDHSAVQKSVFDLGAKLKVTPAESDTSKSLKSQSQETTARLKSLHGAAFDKAYIDNEVGFHKAVIDAVTSVLIPNAQNGELKSALEGAVPLFQGHLEHAKKIQADLETNGATPNHQHDR
jgi:putative membrane protein